MLFQLIKNSLQQGGATIFTTAGLMLVSTSVALFAVNNGVFEHRVANNIYHKNQAFEAAQAGLERGIQYFQVNNSSIVVDSDEDDEIDDYSNSDAITSIDLGNNSTFTVTYSNPIAGDFTNILVTATGTSDGGNVTHTMYTTIYGVSTIQFAPPLPLISRTSVDLGGNVTITNNTNPETIWAGNAVNLTGSATTAPSTGPNSDKHGNGPDVKENDSNLSSLSHDEFFENFFSSPPDTVKSLARYHDVQAASYNYSDDLAALPDTGGIIWLEQTGGDATINGNTTVGSADNPVILVIDGDFKVTGNLTVYGILYVRGTNWDHAGSGNVTVEGAVLTEGYIDTNGTPDVTYSPPLLDDLQTKLMSYTPVPNSWRDFDGP